MVESGDAGPVLSPGGAVWASGAEIFWDLDYLGSATDQAFAADVLGAGMASDQAGSTDVNGLDLLSTVGPITSMNTRSR